MRLKLSRDGHHDEKSFKHGVDDHFFLTVTVMSADANSFSGSQHAASSSQNPSDYLRNASFSRSDTATPTSDPVTASDFLLAAYDPAKLHPLADLGDKLDYLLLEDDKKNELPGSGTAMPSRGWSDDLCYGTGTMYLGGECQISFNLLY